MQKKWMVFASMLLGLTMAGGIILRHQFNSEKWGMGSFLILFSSILIVVSTLLYRKENFIGRLINTRTGQINLLSALLGGLIILIYIWIISIGTWTKWPVTTNYYDLLADAFSHGLLHLEEKPDPALLALADPYNPDNREGIPVLWDLTLYKGEYYLYWGPVPALALALIKPFYSGPVTDNVLTFIYLAGLLIFQIMLILKLWKNYFGEVPGWIILIGISFVGLINPIPYMLLEPRIYEAAVASGQFFFIGGIYWLIAAFNKPSMFNPFLAGLFFALAVGSRTTLVIPIAFLALLALVWATKTQPGQFVKYALTLGLPLALGTVGYGWYNFARFDSITEFGLGYQLTQTDIHESLNESFSISYVPPNLFKLLINPFETKTTFPYFKATPWGGPAWYKSYTPKVYDYYAEDITGILIGSPFLIFAILAASSKQKNIRWITASLAGSSLLLLLTLLLFFYLTMRYLLDLLPVLSLLACIGFWQGFQRIQNQRTAKFIYIISGNILWACTIAISLLICYSNNIHRIRIYNPELIQKVNWAFTHVFK